MRNVSLLVSKPGDLGRPAQAQDVSFSAAAKAVLEGADAVARQLGLKFISTDAIVIALVDRAKRPDAIVDFLAKCATVNFVCVCLRSVDFLQVFARAPQDAGSL